MTTKAAIMVITTTAAGTIMPMIAVMKGTLAAVPADRDRRGAPCQPAVRMAGTRLNTVAGTYQDRCAVIYYGVADQPDCR